MLTLISTMGTCLHYCLHVLLIVFTLYNILSGNITVFEGLAGIRGVLFCFVEGIIPLKYSNIFILIWKWIWASFFFPHPEVSSGHHDRRMDDFSDWKRERDRNKIKKKMCCIVERGRFQQKNVMQWSHLLLFFLNDFQTFWLLSPSFNIALRATWLS